jgi:hypothetical protein
MASTKRRRHRRERRRARVRKPVFTRYQCRCTDESGNPARHWVWVSSKGDVIFRDHKDLSIAAMAAHASMQKAPEGCFYLALRIRERTTDPLYRVARLDAHMISEAGAKMLKGLDVLRAQRVARKVAARMVEMRPLPQSLVYRRSLLGARMLYRVHALAKRIQERMGCPEDELQPGAAALPFDVSSMISEHGYYTYRVGDDDDNFAWDY